MGMVIERKVRLPVTLSLTGISDSQLERDLRETVDSVFGREPDEWEVSVVDA